MIERENLNLKNLNANTTTPQMESIANLVTSAPSLRLGWIIPRFQ